MNRIFPWLTLCAVLVVASLIGSPCSFANDGAADDRHDQAHSLIKKYCFDCHGDGASEGDLNLDGVESLAQAASQPELWWKVLKNVRAGVMPPPDEARPTPEEFEALANWVKFDVFGINPDDPDPGRLSVRRLNRDEYGNTINDLMGVRFDAKLIFPADDSGHGFDNVGDALSFSNLLMEKYLKTARLVVAEAVPTTTKIVPLQVFRNRDFSDSTGRDGGHSLNGKQPHQVNRSFTVDEDGQYDVEVGVKLHGSFDFDPARYTVRFSIDDEPRFEHEYGWDENKLIEFQYDVQWKSGQHEMAFQLTPVEPEDTEEVEESSNSVRFEIASIRIEGPRGTDRLVHPPNYERFFSRDEPPESLADRRTYAAEVLRSFAARAFRSEVSDETVERLVAVAEATYTQPDTSFESGVAKAMLAVLASPRFLFHLESLPAETNLDYGLVDEMVLASRMSYFLWSTMPDEELLQLARSGQLRAQLPGQIERMMADERSKTWVKNFVGQWLRTRDVSQVEIDPLVILGLKQEYEEIRAIVRSKFDRRRRREERSPEDQKLFDRYRELRDISDRFDEGLRRAMRLETEMCVEFIVNEDGSLLDLIDCDYTFLNEQLAKHYGIPDVEGSEMRRVVLPDDSPRGGVLTHASMLLVTSNPTRTSPVKRGLFILENILGTPSPPAPAGIPNLEESADRFGDREPTQRELLAAHREAPICTSCHARMDPLGFALENFNALGVWRDSDQDQPIESEGTLITGESFKNIIDLKEVLREHHAKDFYRCLTEKMLTYALGRGVEYSDEHTVDLIVEELEKSGGKFRVLVRAIIESAPFQKQRFGAMPTTE